MQIKLSKKETEEESPKNRKQTPKIAYIKTELL